MIRYTPSASVTRRSVSEEDSAASGSAHSTYQGSTQLSVTSNATLAQPAAVIVSRRRHASQQQARIDAISAATSTLRRVSLSPPAPIARPIRLGMLSLVTSRPWVLRSGMCSPKASRLEAATTAPAASIPISTCTSARGLRSRPASTTGISTAAEALIAMASTNAAPAPIWTAESGSNNPRSASRARPSPPGPARRSRSARRRAAAAPRCVPAAAGRSRPSCQDHQRVVVAGADAPHEHDRVEPHEHDRAQRVATQQLGALPDEQSV